MPSNKQQLSHLIAIYSPRRFNTAESLVVSELEWFLIRLLVCLRVQHFILSAPLVSVKTPEALVLRPPPPLQNWPPCSFIVKLVFHPLPFVQSATNKIQINQKIIYSKVRPWGVSCCAPVFFGLGLGLGGVVYPCSYGLLTSSQYFCWHLYLPFFYTLIYPSFNSKQRESLPCSCVGCSSLIPRSESRDRGTEWGGVQKNPRRSCCVCPCVIHHLW